MRELPVEGKPGEVELKYLTLPDLKTKRGKELREHLGSRFYHDICGHGAIDWYYNLKGRGYNREYTDFSNPSKMPPEIAEAIKRGDLRGIGIAPALLTKQARATYDAAIKPAGVTYAAAIMNIFWDLFADPKNRIKAWR